MRVNGSFGSFWLFIMCTTFTVMLTVADARPNSKEYPQTARTRRSLLTEFSVTLADGGGNPSQGRLQVNIPDSTTGGSKTGTVCQRGYSAENNAIAEVICRQLGYSGTSSYTTDSSYGPSNLPMVMYDLTCQGTEINIANCVWKVVAECNGETAPIRTREYELGIQCSNSGGTTIGGTTTSPSPVPVRSPVISSQPPPRAPSPPPSPGGGGVDETSSSSSSTGIIIGVVVGCVLVLGIVIAGFVLLRREKRDKEAPIPYTNLYGTTKSVPSASYSQMEPTPAYSPLGTKSPAYYAGTTLPATRPEQQSLLLTNVASLNKSILSQSSMNVSGDPVLRWAASRQLGSPSSPAKTLSLKSKATIPPYISAMEFTWQKARIIRPLGMGSFGKVFLAQVHHTAVALKVLIDANALELPSSSGNSLGVKGQSSASSIAVAPIEKMIEEVAAMAPLRHPNVVALVGYCFNPPAIALEYCANGSLFSILQRAKTEPEIAAWLTFQRRLGMAADAAAGMLHLHTRQPPVLHRDLKSPNLLVAADGTVKIADMGLSRLVLETTHNASTVDGPSNPRWLSPQVLDGGKYTTAADVFSFAVVMWEMLTYELPWIEEKSLWVIVAKVRDGERPALPASLRDSGVQRGGGADIQPWEENAFQEYVALMNRCWAQSAEQRPDFEEIADALRSMAQQNTDA